MTQVLVVDNDPQHCHTISKLLGDEGFEVSTAHTGRTALRMFDENGADLILLDLVLPDLPGTELCQQLRRHPGVSVVIISARAGEVDRVIGLEAGADDYVAKPYSSLELMARIRALRRRQRWLVAEVAPTTPVLAAGPVRVDTERHVVTVKDAVVRLPLKEFELLELLLRNAGRVLTRRQIIERVWGAEHVGDIRTLDTHVRRLRGRVEPVPSAPRHLVTVRGMGFRFQP